MKNLKHNLKNLLICSFLLIAISFPAHAQKLPKIQEVSVRAPAKVKIDGKATEWGNQFQAYNKNTEIFYTIANDDEKLYLIVRVIKPFIINKVIKGGITFTINHAVEKKDKQPVSVTFPAFEKDDKQAIGHIVTSKPDATDDSLAMKKETDSVMHLLNKQMIAKCKVMVIKGIKAFDDTLLSVYNEEGIKAAALFNNKLAYTYELAIPLKYLGITANSPVKFSYNITLNSMPINLIGIAPKDIAGITVMGGTITIEGPGAAEFNALSSPTDFWGEYSLAAGR